MITAVAGHEMRASGLEEAGSHDIVQVAGEVPALVVALERSEVRLVRLVDAEIAPGAPVRWIGKPTLQVGASLLGQVLSGSELLLPSRQRGEDRPLFSAPLPAWRRPRKRGVFTTGLLVHDIKGELRRGEAILLPGLEGRRAFALHVGGQILRHQEQEGAICIFVRLASSATSLDTRRLLEALTCVQGSASARAAGSNTVFLEPGRHATPAMAWLLCRAAVVLAQAFAERGSHVVLLVDGFFQLGKMGVRQIPGFSQLAELGRLTSAADCHETGSVTVLVTSDTPAGAQPLQLFDAWLDLENTRMGSIAHRGSKLCRPPIRVEPMNVLGRILAASAYADSARGYPTDDAMVRRGRRIQEALRFQIASRLDLLEQLLCLLAVARLETLEVDDVAPFVERYLQVLREQHAAYLQTLRAANVVPDDPSETWATVAMEVAIPLNATTPEEPAGATAARPKSGRPWWKIW